MEINDGLQFLDVSSEIVLVLKAGCILILKTYCTAWRDVVTCSSSISSIPN